MSDANEAEDSRSTLVAIAKLMLGGQMHLIEGSRQICALRHAVGDPDNSVFMPIRAFESETDHFPLGEMRKRCAANYLQKADDDMRRYVAEAEKDVLAACAEIVRIFSEDV